MKLGVVLPQAEIGSDPIAIRDYVQAAEELGYAHLLVYEHVLSADPKHHQGMPPRYWEEDIYHEPFVLFGYLAAVTPPTWNLLPTSWSSGRVRRLW